MSFDPYEGTCWECGRERETVQYPNGNGQPQPHCNECIEYLKKVRDE